MASHSRSYPLGPGTFAWRDWLLMRQDPLAFASGLAKKYGDVVYLKILGSYVVYLLNNPSDIRDVLVVHRERFHNTERNAAFKPLLGEGLFNSEDEIHLRQRRLMQPAFHRQSIASYADVAVEYTQRASQRWLDGTTLDMLQEMKYLTLAIIDKILFDVDVEQKAWKIREEFSDWLDMFQRYAALPLAAILLQFPLLTTRRLQRSRTQLDPILSKIIEEHRRSGKERGGLLALLLLAQDTAGEGKGMSEQQMRDEVRTLFLAGREPLTSGLTWTWYLLAQHPEVAATLQAELSEVLAGRPPTAQDLPHLKYTEMVLAEAMRLFPPSYIMTRRAIAEHQVGPYTIPVGATVVMSQYVVHRDPRFYPDPERFDPERFRPEARAARPKFAYFPFGGGHKVCLGESLSWMVGVLVLATLAQSWEFRLLPPYQVEPSCLMSLRPKQGKHGLRMTLQRRHSPAL